MNRASTELVGDISVNRSYIEAALEYAGGTHTFEDIAAAVVAGRMQYWPAPASAVITEIIDFPQFRAINIFLAGGNMAEMEKLEPLIMDWARAQGCKQALFTGRRGWDRTFLSRAGWEKSELVVLEKQLDG